MDENLELPETFDFEDLGLILQPDLEFFISNTALLEDVVEFNGIHMRSFRNRPYYTYSCGLGVAKLLPRSSGTRRKTQRAHGRITEQNEITR